MLFETATRQKLRFQLSRGNASVEDLWDLNLTELNNIAKVLRRKLKQDQEEDFLEVKSDADATEKLRFDVVLHVLNTKKVEKVANEEAKNRKMERDKILAILAQKQESALSNMSAEDLQKRLAELS